MAELPGASPQTPEQVVGGAIQDMAAKRLGKGFMPLGCAFAVGLAQLFTHGPGSAEAIGLAAGAPLAAGAMLAHGLRIVQAAFLKPHRPWMTLASLGTVIPPLFGVYLFGWRGLREIASGAGADSAVLGVLFTALGIWALVTWMKLNELIGLTRVMVGGMGGAEPMNGGE